MFRYFLLILLIVTLTSGAVTTDEFKNELLRFRGEIDLLKAENKNQSVQIATLMKDMFELKHKKRVRDHAKNGDGNFSKSVAHQKELPSRIIPVLVNELGGFKKGDNIKNCRLLAAVIYDDVTNKSKISQPTNCSEEKPFHKFPFLVDDLLRNSLNKSDSPKNYYRLLTDMVYDRAVKAASSKPTIPPDRSSKTTKPPRKFYGQPTNCSDLFDMGHTLNGFYTVKSADGDADNVKLETIFCAFKQPEGVAFNPSAVEERIADLSLVSSNVEAVDPGIHFHVQKHHKTKFPNDNPVNAFIPFDKVILNMGEAFDKKHTFIAPKPGVYQFVFTLVMDSIPNSSSTTVTLCLNALSNVIGKSSTNDAGSTIAIESTIILKKGDKIYLATYLGGGFQIEWASFSGSLLEAIQPSETSETSVKVL